MKKIKTATALLLVVALLHPVAACAASKTEGSVSTSDGDFFFSESTSRETAESSLAGENTFESSSSSESAESSDSSTDSSDSDASASASSPDVVETPTKESVQYIRLLGDDVYLRKGAGTQYAVLGKAYKDEIYAVIDKIGNWYKTRYRNQTAYLYAAYAAVFTLPKTDKTTEQVLDEGYSLLGTPYVYGAIRLHDGKGKLLSGFDKQKFDCSSLVQYVYYKGANALLDVTTRTQIKQGVSVSKSALRRGDCMYFTNESRQNNSGIERVGHVAIYLGDGYILHTASDYARIEKMTTRRWSFFLEARRFL